MNWQPIETAPKDRDILVYFDHDADPFHDPADPDRLTDYAANAEGGSFLDGKGYAVAKWCDPLWDSTDEYGGGYWLPGGWFSRGDDGAYEAICNATHWSHLEPPNAA